MIPESDDIFLSFSTNYCENKFGFYRRQRMLIQHWEMVQKGKFNSSYSG